MRATAASILAATMLVACAPRAPSLAQQIEGAVRATIAAMPSQTAPPPPTAQPTTTPVTLRGIFCEYQFCIGHPDDMAFYDVVAKQNPSSPAASRYDDGILAANTSNLFIQLIWQDAPPGTDPQFMLDVILQYGTDTRNGGVEPLSSGNLTVFYVSITPTPAAASTLPFGGAAAWVCGGRAFAWKVYTSQADLARNLMMQAVEAFRCET